MQALLCTAVGAAQLAGVPRSQPRPGELEIAVELAGICGLDAAAFAGRSRIASLPAILGHELTGRLADGRRVVANPFIPCGCCPSCLAGSPNLCAHWRLLGANALPGCFAQFVCLPQSHIHAIPVSLSSARAVLAEPLANAVHLLRIAAFHPGLSVAILGAGLMGSLTLQAALHAGPSAVSVVEPLAPRRASALSMGAAAAWPTADRALAAGSSFDLVFDCSGAAKARALALALCRPGGAVALLGMAARRSPVDWNAAIRRELRIHTSFGFTPDDFAQSVALLAAGRVHLDDFLQEYPLAEGQQALQAACTPPGPILKRVLRIA